ncbi:hypothetical protein DCC35_18000 [Mangrovivirga cuniculi]|uniref:Glycosyl transferase family 1 domain-containing protein n=1 Tax=Mangrovivirga cuniculi TaxID=2715131 RepID=A0A4D7JPB6_9BACT|nr:hypothetical protein DCC35_18000 [Mangrovivirga cuniculi]
MKVIKILRSNNIQIIHINDLYNMIGVMVKIIDPKIKVIYHIRLLPNSYVKKLYKVWLNLITKYADVIISVSKVVSAGIKKNDKVKLVYDGLNVEELPINQREAPIKKPLKFLYLSNYISGKGQDFALLVFKKLIDTGINAKLDFYGSTMNKTANEEYKSMLLNKVQQFGLVDKVNLNDFSSSINAIIDDSDIVMLFSESESFSFVVLEAMGRGKPVIATRCGGPEELIEHEISGVLVDKDKPEQIIYFLNKLCENKEMREKLGNSAYLRIKEKFNLNVTSEKILEIYK